MTKLAYVSLQTLIKEKAADTGTAKKATSLALGVAISRLLPMPTTQVESAEEHFAVNVRHLGELFIATFNEEIVVDVDLTAETLRGFWLVRYFSAFPQEDFLVAGNGDASFLLKLTGAVRYLNADTQAFCDENSEMMISLVNRITSVLHQPAVEAVSQEPALRRG